MIKRLLLTLICFSIILSGYAFAEELSTALDPMYLGVGARPLGMGKCFVAIAEDSEAILLNPAGLGLIGGAKFTSMYTNLMSQANYMVLAGAMPVSDAVGIGAGFVAISVDDIGLYDNTGVSQGTASYMNGVVFLSAGINLEKDEIISSILPNKGKDILLGVNLKLFIQNASGSDLVSDANGSGVNADFAILYKPDTWYSFGLNHQNFLSHSSGAKMKFIDDVEEEIPSVTKIGSKISVFGKEKALYKSEQSLDVALDLDLTSWGTAAHIGAEYKPEKWIALRAGIDQDAGPVAVETNPTFGVGFLYAGYSFDYAYHPYGEVAENATHFFSISFVGDKETDKNISASIVNPKDKTITRENKMTILGNVAGLGDKGTVKVNGLTAYKKKEGYVANVPLDKPGKQVITLDASSGKKKALDNIRVLRLLSFDDVGKDYWARNPIESCATLGLVEGYPNGKFLPEKTLTRAELATLVARARKLDLPDVNSSVFKDLPKSHWAAAYVLAAKEAGLIKGYPDGTFRPNQKITRAEGIMLFARTDGLEDDYYLEEKPYTDVSLKHWAVGMISAAKEEGFMKYIKGDKLNPNSRLTRAEAVEILSKTSLAKYKIKNLWDFSAGYFDDERPEKVTRRDKKQNDGPAVSIGFEISEPAEEEVIAEVEEIKPPKKKVTKKTSKKEDSSSNEIII